MKKETSRGPNIMSGDLRPEYRFDYGKSKPNCFAVRFGEKAVAVVLAPDVAEAFPTAEAVNEALRLLAAMARSAARVSSRVASPKRPRSSPRRQLTKRR
jgi:hypothetical protein